MKLIITTLLILSCAKPEIQPIPPVSNDADLVREKLTSLLDDAITQSESREGWLVDDTCDAMMWTSLFGTATKSFINISAAESETEPGRFYRTRQKTCWVKGREKQRSGSTWSRDMSIAFLIYLYSQGDLETIERHIEYGEENGWIMGDGYITRTAYSPALISLWYQTAKALGHNYGYLPVDNLYKSGLIDYEAHLQMLFIFHSGELNGGISNAMADRILEHSGRLPNLPFYEFLRAKYFGGIDDSASLCLRDDSVVGDYVRCHDKPCELAEEIFVCGLVAKFLYDSEGK